MNLNAASRFLGIFTASHEIDGVRKEKERLTAAWTSHTFGLTAHSSKMKIMARQEIDDEFTKDKASSTIILASRNPVINRETQ